MKTAPTTTRTEGKTTMDEPTRSAFITLIDILQDATTELDGVSQHDSFDRLDKTYLQSLKSDLLKMKVDE